MNAFFLSLVVIILSPVTRNVGTSYGMPLTMQGRTITANQWTLGNQSIHAVVVYTYTPTPHADVVRTGTDTLIWTNIPRGDTQVKQPVIGK